MVYFLDYDFVSGNTAPDQKEPTPFIIEWIPDILPRSHIGELRLKFEYGHQRNGHVVKKPLPHIAPAPASTLSSAPSQPSTTTTQPIPIQPHPQPPSQQQQQQQQAVPQTSSNSNMLAQVFEVAGLQ